ncbi:helix-turn-helix domain-containing protein [Pseudooceanicola sp.]|uniref:helix-turn-helix domain-containing protein n=1 Tax=Pseudooceanicola sp. TaxID=1914328 RepID=UPI00351739E0
MNTQVAPLRPHVAASGAPKKIGAIGLELLRHERWSSYRPFALPSALPRNSVVFVFQLDGDSVVLAGERLNKMTRGRFRIFPGEKLIGLDMDPDARTLAVGVPRTVIESRLRLTGQLFGRSFSTTGANWRFAIGFAQMLAEESDQIPPETAFRHGRQLTELICTAIEQELDECAQHSASDRLLNRCRAYIEAHHGDMSLTPDRIASDNGISVRYLHKVFQASDQSVCGVLRQTRLASACEILTDPSNRHLSIREVACRVGFRSQSHFATAFKSRFGTSATAWRRNRLTRPGMVQ